MSNKKKHKGKSKGKGKPLVKPMAKTKTKDTKIKWANCSHEPTLVCKIGGLEVFGATKSNLSGNTEGFDLVLNCTYSSIAKLSDMRFPAKYACLKKHLAIPVDEIVLDWPDGGSYPVKLAFWREFYDVVQAQGVKKLAVTCLGGHGRTGTAIASLIVANSDYKALDAMKLVRAALCRECIETHTQEKYLYDLEFERTGIEPTRVYSEFKTSSGKTWGNWSSGGGSGYTTQTYQTNSNDKCQNPNCGHFRYLHCHAKDDSCIASACVCNLFIAPPKTEAKTEGKTSEPTVTDKHGKPLCICQHSHSSHIHNGKGRCFIHSCDCDFYYPDSGDSSAVSAFASLPIEQ